MEERLEKEIERIENDDSLTQSEKNDEIKELISEYNEGVLVLTSILIMAEEAAQKAYTDEYERW